MVKYQNRFVDFDFTDYILNVKIKKSSPEVSEWQETLKTLRAFYQSAVIGQYKYTIVFDIRQLGLIDISYYWECSKIFTEDKNLTKKHIIKTIFLTDSDLIKNTLDWFFYLCPPSNPIIFVSKEEEIKQNLKLVISN